jgi:release factor glutamine methyltransferase
LTPAQLVEQLAEAGCVAAEEEAAELMEAAGSDPLVLEAMAARRVTGEPLAWITGSARFAGCTVLIDRGVYVPRHQTGIVVEAAAEVLPPGGVAVDLCTGSGAIAVALSARRPGARVMGADVDPVACRCARRNGVEVYEGDLSEPLPRDVFGAVDVVTAVPPYVPTPDLLYLPRDVRDHEPRLALDGGLGGTVVLERIVSAAARLLRAGGHLVVEVGGEQDVALAPLLAAYRFRDVELFRDEDGDLRALRTVIRVGS